jgi:hypothetical protein
MTQVDLGLTGLTRLIRSLALMTVIKNLGRHSIAGPALIREEQGRAASIRTRAGDGAQAAAAATECGRRRSATGGGGARARQASRSKGKEIRRGRVLFLSFAAASFPPPRTRPRRSQHLHACTPAEDAGTPTAPAPPLLAAAGTNCRRQCARRVAAAAGKTLLFGGVFLLSPFCTSRCLKMQNGDLLELVLWACSAGPFELGLEIRSNP